MNSPTTRSHRQAKNAIGPEPAAPAATLRPGALLRTEAGTVVVTPSHDAAAHSRKGPVTCSLCLEEITRLGLPYRIVFRCTHGDL